ncbi:glycosyltransferase family 2 protein [Ligilactobacillus salivarius]|uniref:glycosyltransferase family 2 protein n=2 Tax=Ligilactobacillus salivarius TaxID=1624 RepID=UPI000BB01846|nr:glycosyltransferase family 2 protein [Ligilactobacillus salivarius]PAY51781.1 benzoate transporter [Ligilactobacillus salivarius]PAY53606.1 benzoate transporter [Ligilactobacillus salivarius]PAY57587.1 benzoate transporter [Ligilactobacillus salivarius]
MVKISIGMPIYNVAEYLSKYLDSIINQTFTDFEVIMVDDGSTDGRSFEICQEYVERDKRFRLIHQKNGGRSAARNTALKNMTGEYITWVDSDDWIEDDYFERLIRTQERTGADMVCIGIKTFMNNEFYMGSHQDKYGAFPGHVIPKKIGMSDIFWGIYALISVWGNIMDAKLYKGVVFSEGIALDDQGNKFKLFLQSEKIVGIPELGYVYRIRSGSITQDGVTNFEKIFEGKVMQITNLEKSMYYIENANYEVDYFHSLYSEWLDKQLQSVDSGWDDDQQERYRSFVLKHRKLFKKRLVKRG